MNIKRTSNFLLDKEPGKADAKLRYRIKWGKEIVAFSLGIRVDVDKWSTETQRCKNSTTHTAKKIPANIINRLITKTETIIDEIFNAYELKDQIPTADQIRNDYNVAVGKAKKQTHSFFDVFDEFVKTMGKKNSWSNATYTKFNSLRTHLYNFNPDISFEKLDEDSLYSFLEYLHSIEAMKVFRPNATEAMRNTTIAKMVSYNRWFLNWCEDKGYYSGNLNKTFRPKLKGTDGNSKEVVYLTFDELIHLYNYNFVKEYLGRVRDVFCFCCFTGLRYSDVKKLKRTDVKDNFISVVTKKTVDAITIQLNKFSKAILDKYKDFNYEDNSCLPVVSNAKMNEYLKEMGEVAGLTQPQRIVYFIGSERIEEVLPKYALICTHTGRRTFIVNSMYLGIPAEVIMEWTGHSDYKAMKPYVKIIEGLKQKEMSKFDSVPVFQNRD